MVTSSKISWRPAHLSRCKRKERIGEKKQKLVVQPAITSIGSYCPAIVVLDED